MTSKKLGALLRSAPPATGDSLPPSPTSTLDQYDSTPELARASGSPEDHEVPLQVLIPSRVRKQLALLAAEEGKSLRALVLLAVRSLGIAVTDEDIRGKRGKRSNRLS